MKKEVLVETSARHVHVTQADLETLFGAGYELTKKKDLSQPGQFACEERVQVIGSKGSFPKVSILGPVRPETQVVLCSAAHIPLPTVNPAKDGMIFSLARRAKRFPALSLN